MSPCAALVFLSLSLSAGPYPYTGEPATAPHDLCRFPPPAAAHEAMQTAQCQSERLRLQCELFPWDRDLWWAREAWRHRERCYSLLWSAHCGIADERCLDYLRLLRAELGREAWYGGRMP